MIKIDDLLKKALKEVPVFKDEYERLIDIDEIDTESGEQIAFSYAFTPKLVEAIENDDKIVYDNMLEFVEKMAESTDVRVSEVCDYAIMEVLNDNFTKERLWPLFGEKTKESYNAVKEYML